MNFRKTDGWKSEPRTGSNIAALRRGVEPPVRPHGHRPTLLLLALVSSAPTSGSRTCPYLKVRSSAFSPAGPKPPLRAALVLAPCWRCSSYTSLQSCASTRQGVRREHECRYYGLALRAARTGRGFYRTARARRLHPVLTPRRADLARGREGGRRDDTTGCAVAPRSCPDVITARGPLLRDKTRARHPVTGKGWTSGTGTTGRKFESDVEEGSGSGIRQNPRELNRILLELEP